MHDLSPTPSALNCNPSLLLGFFFPSPVSFSYSLVFVSLDTRQFKEDERI